MAEVIERRNGGSIDGDSYALFSGGHDSLVNTYYCVENGHAETVIHIDTGIGIPETTEYVRRVCDRNGWPLVVLTSDHDYREIVLENGFPGPGVHIILYSKLKERALRHIPRQIDTKPKFYTGVRADESSRRFKNVIPRQEDSQWVWHAKIWDWCEEKVVSYIQENGLEKSPVKQLYHHSGECLCGCFGNRTEELAVLEAHYPEAADRIKQLENEVQERHGVDDKRSYWAHGAMSSIDLRALLADNDETQMILCQSCEKTIQENNNDL